MLLGTETEYGIHAAGGELDAHDLSAAVVDACGVPATASTGDASHRVLGNGARFYVDHGHPEYATPETTSAADATLWELAGDLIVERAAAAASQRLGIPITVFKNNTDGKGNSYGYHENLLVGRATPWEALEAVLPAFLVSRVVIAGAGRVGLGTASQEPGFQLSQRADFFERVAGLDTTRRRGIVNTRDEPHADPRRWRRLHVIAGDATRIPYATWLGLGSLALVVAAIESGLAPLVRLADPIVAFRTVSRDLSLSRPLPLAGGGAETALGVQERFRDAAAALAGRVETPGATALVEAWTQTLDDLRVDPARAADRLDWAAKLQLLRGYRARGASWGDPKLAQVDLKWAQLGPGGIVGVLQDAGRLRAGADPAEVERAGREAPRDTRAFGRGRWVSEHPEAVIAAGWDGLLVRDPAGGLHSLGLLDPFGHTAVGAEPGASVDRLIRSHEERTR
ncbi:proteasome accessory factor PafA2 family protein [Propioniciclava coleopterorum]|uniref:Proteasome accessory factor PafA2 family protein n=1 Tax=Propioniciclava coleopterorum TaxID=2714937 RepID=A0A6G7Y9G3_9ACTN|nr:proteasome accessory factor PafA2 family protein [Propioniciclava coleopterorum]QIK73534.1 proteasome accessory factor PafA2 family protein [Propioniciclava coleopterorum]